MTLARGRELYFAAGSGEPWRRSVFYQTRERPDERLIGESRFKMPCHRWESRHESAKLCVRLIIHWLRGHHPAWPDDPGKWIKTTTFTSWQARGMGLYMLGLLQIWLKGYGNTRTRRLMEGFVYWVSFWVARSSRAIFSFDPRIRDEHGSLTKRLSCDRLYVGRRASTSRRLKVITTAYIGKTRVHTNNRI